MASVEASLSIGGMRRVLESKHGRRDAASELAGVPEMFHLRLARGLTILQRRQELAPLKARRTQLTPHFSSFGCADDAERSGL